jgi:hypothetical protein
MKRIFTAGIFLRQKHRPLAGSYQISIINLFLDRAHLPLNFAAGPGRVSTFSSSSLYHLASMFKYYGNETARLTQSNPGVGPLHFSVDRQRISRIGANLPGFRDNSWQFVAHSAVT